MTFEQILQEKIDQYKDDPKICNVLREIEIEHNKAYLVKSLDEYWDAFKTPLELRIRFSNR